MLIIAGTKVGAPHLYEGVDRFMAGKEKALMTNVQVGSIEMINVASGVMKLDKRLVVEQN